MYDAQVEGPENPKPEVSFDTVTSFVGEYEVLVEHGGGLSKYNLNLYE